MELICFTSASVRNRRPARRAGILVYAVVALTALIGLCSLAVDWGRVQMVKTELQRTADTSARGYLSIYQNYGASYADSYGPYFTYPTINSYSDNVAPTVTATWGYWDAATGTFYAGTNSSYPLAVRCVASRTAANNNAIPLMWGRVLGRPRQDLTCTAVAIMTAASSGSVSVPGTSDLYLAGMPAGSTASYDDTTANAAPYQATSIPVIPGSYITFTGVSGTVGNAPGTSEGPDGNAGYMWSHGNPNPGMTPGAENGIGDATMPRDAFMGVFLDNSAPNTTAAPAARDYSSGGSRDAASYDDIALKQVFFIGDGRTSGGATQTFRVPAGATRLYLGAMDTYEWNNNPGSFAATINVVQTISVVK